MTEEDILRKAQPYINSGLDENFAIAIAEGVAGEKVLKLWEMEWWKQYTSDDILVVRMLSKENSISIEDGEWLSNTRSDHERLVMAVCDGSIEVDFARALLDGGFEKHQDAVNDVLDGGDPVWIARIRKLKNTENLPPPLGFKVTRKLTWDETKQKRVESQKKIKDPPSPTPLVKSALGSTSPLKLPLEKMVDDFLEDLEENKEWLTEEVFAETFDNVIPDKKNCPICSHEVSETDFGKCNFCGFERENS